MQPTDLSARVATQRPVIGRHQPPALVDGFGRRITYLRLSISDRCDFRCIYCVPSKKRFADRKERLSLDELARVAAAFVDLGAHKIRLTGGEPLLRPGALELIRQIAALPRLTELVLTTNGSQLERLASPLRKAGVRRINISLDSLQPERFRALTRTGDLAKVLRGIDNAIAAGFERIKLNSVILKGRNHDEILDLARFAMAKGINLSFIEEMPFGTIGDYDRAETFYPADRIREQLAAEFALVPTTESTGGPARYYRIPGSETRVGFIAPRSHNFCSACNRVRVTADGRLLPCLGDSQSVDLRAVLRAYPSRTETLKTAIAEAMGIKPERCEFSPDSKPIEFRHLMETGG